MQKPRCQGYISHHECNEVWQVIARGRGELERGLRPGSSASEYEQVVRLLELLWHPSKKIQRAAALALPGGSCKTHYTPHYGHFAMALLQTVRGDAACAQNRLACVQRVETALEQMLQKNTADLRSMSSMHYSFLSNSLYLALLATCRDIVESIRRLQVQQAQAVLCDLLHVLVRPHPFSRINSADAAALSRAVSRAFASMRPEATPQLFADLIHADPLRRRASAAVLECITDVRAVPFLLQALQHIDVSQSSPLIACLGRLGDDRALPALAGLTASRHLKIRRASQAALQSIQRSRHGLPSAVLLRPVRLLPEQMRGLLRPICRTLSEPPEILLHPAEEPL